MSEDKMRLDSRAAAIKACTDSYEQKLAIKEAEITQIKLDYERAIAEHEKCKGHADFLREEIASRDLMIKELREALQGIAELNKE